MRQNQHKLAQTRRNCWKRYLIDGILALLTSVPVIIFVLPLHFHLSTTTVILGYLLIIFLLVHKRKLATAVLATLIACFVIDFFLVQPVFSLTINNPDEALDLAFFFVLALILGRFHTQSQERADKAKQQEQAISILHEEEASRRASELGIFFDMLQQIRDEKHLQQQLNIIAQRIDDAFSLYGLWGCILLLPDFGGNSHSLLTTIQSANSSSLSREEEAAALWVIQHGKPVVIRNNAFEPTKNRCLRRVVRSGSIGLLANGSSYITPLLSRSKVIGGVRFLVKDNTHPRFAALKKSLEMQVCGESTSDTDFFLAFLRQAVILIEQVLIERALRQEEELRMELWNRTKELHAAILSSVSHDLKTPLTSIKANATSLLDRWDIWNDDKERRASLAEIVNETTWLERMISKMLDLSSLEQGKLNPEMELYPFETIVLNTLERGYIHGLIQDRYIEKSGLEHLPPIEVDPIMIGQVLGNLLENAARYTPAGSPIEISGHVHGKYMIIGVIDHGPGIPPLEKERIFEKFYRVTTKREESNTEVMASFFRPSTRGSGLGLAICRGFVEIHKGRIWVENLDDGGAKFQFALPLRQKWSLYEENPHC